MTGDDLVIVIPLWRRTSHIERVYESAVAATPEAHVMWVVSDGDHEVRRALGQHVVRERGRGLDSMGVIDGAGGEPGDYARKVNFGYARSEQPFIFTGADDLHFHPGWYEAARWEMDREGVRVLGGRPTADGGMEIGTEPLPPVGVVGTVDLCNDRTMRGEASTHSLVARWYADCCAVADRPGAIYCEQYPHDYCDDELVQTAMARGAYAHAHDAVVEHLHPNVQKAPDDATYMHGRARRRQGRILFGRRRRLWAGA